ncbi:MAG: flagellar biosynthesis protein FlhB [Paracoccaceae bacterium]|nr:MAG: flagellar biosynthesis protein FlhB [Paracoccaceae bacterium]
MSGRSEEGGEKSFAPTPKRLEDARRRGDVPRSADLAAAAAYLGLLVAIAAFGAAAVRAAGSELAFFLGRPEQLQGRVLGAEGAGLLLLPLARAAAAILPFLMMPLAAAFLAHLAQGSFAASAEKLLPKLSRISPIANAAQKFGPTGLVAFAKSTVKMVAAAAVLGLFLADAMNEIIGSLRAPPALVGAEMMRLATGLLAAIAAIAVVIAAADWLWQRFDHARRLRMSFQEIRDEAREIEGDPHQKQARRRRAEEIARNRMLADVATADVVIVNPTHYAVALKWTRKPGSAPHCVAKGRDETALAIRARAIEAGVPVRSDPPTARTLFALVEIGQEVPPETWRAVAAAIRFAEQMRARARDGWRGRG